MAESDSKSMLDGLKDRSAKDGDASMTPKGGSVNSETTRSKPAEQPPTLGPRCA